MRAHILFLLITCVAINACGDSSPKERSYKLQGQVLSIDADRQMANIKHEEIKGFMAAMTMPYKVQDAKALAELKPGDLINARVSVVPNDAFLTDVKRVGHAPLEQAPETQRATSSGVEILKPGDLVPSPPFTDQDGKTRGLDAFRGSTIVLTFIYTRCPIDTFCPLMDRHFAEIQRAMAKDPALAKIQLVSVSFDPVGDTPAVLKKHAREVKADPTRWTFLTGEREAIERFGSAFGLFANRSAASDADITHNLRTAVIDPRGRLVKIYTGNEWTPAQLLVDLKDLKDAPNQPQA
jgi:protein SCO1